MSDPSEPIIIDDPEIAAPAIERIDEEPTPTPPKPENLAKPMM